MIKLHSKSKVEFIPLEIRKEDQEYVIGSTKTNIFVKVSPIGKKIIIELMKGCTIGCLQDKFKGIDIKDFLHQMIIHKFVAKIGTTRYHTPGKKVKDLFPFIKKENVQWIFSPFMYSSYFIIILIAIVMLYKNPAYFPSYKAYFFVASYTLLIPLSYLIGCILVFFHENAHLLPARSLGVKANISISNRLYFLVAITDITGVYSIERKKRYRTYFAGIVNDMLIMSICIILLYLNDNSIFSLNGLVYNMLRFIMLVELLGLLWQFMFFIKTDLYYIVENFFKIDNLQLKTKLFLTFLLKNIYKPVNHFTPYFENTKEVMILYLNSLILVVGITLTMLFFIDYNIPIFMKMLIGSIKNILDGSLIGTYLFYDSLIAIIFITINFSLLFFSLIKKHHLYKKQYVIFSYVFLLMICNYATVFFIIIYLIMQRFSLLTYLSLLFMLGFLFAYVERMIFNSLTKIATFYNHALIQRFTILTFFSPIIFFYIIIQLIPILRFSDYYFLSSIAYILGIAANYLREKYLHTISKDTALAK